MGRFTGRKSPRVLLRLVLDRRRNIRRLDAQEQFERNEHGSFQRTEKTRNDTDPVEIPSRKRMDGFPATRTK
jgi:hypothetical protein